MVGVLSEGDGQDGREDGQREGSAHEVGGEPDEAEFALYGAREAEEALGLVGRVFAVGGVELVEQFGGGRSGGPAHEAVVAAQGGTHGGDQQSSGDGERRQGEDGGDGGRAGEGRFRGDRDADGDG